MKKLSLLKKILFSSFSFAVIPTFIIMFFLHPLSSRHKLLLDRQAQNNIFDYFVDLNSDSIFLNMNEFFEENGEKLEYNIIIDDGISIK